MGLFNPAALPFAAVVAATGWLDGLLIKHGGFTNVLSVILSGTIVGLITGALVSLFREMGNSLLGSVTLHAFISDPLDKVVVLFVVWPR